MKRNLEAVEITEKKKKKEKEKSMEGGVYKNIQKRIG